MKEELDRMLAEDRERMKKFTGKHDQFTGEGMEGHTHKFCLKGYAIPTQWLNDQTWNDPIYQEMRKYKSIDEFMEKNPDADLELLYARLINTRIVTDPAFAFYVAFSIKYKSGGRGPFILNYPQRVMLAMLEAMRLAGIPIRIVIDKARQWGGSTLAQLYIAWLQLFVREQWNSVIVAQTKDTAKRIKAMYSKTLSDIPGVIFGLSELKFSPYEGASSDSIITDAGGKVIRDNVITTASYENFESTRGMDYAMAHFSEVAYWKPTPSKSAEDVVTNILGNINDDADTIVIMESTARGAAGLFYDTYQAAKNGTSMFKALFIPFFFIENDMLRKRMNRYEKVAFAKWLISVKNDTQAPNSNSESGMYLYSLWTKGATLEHIRWYIERRKAFTDHAQMASEAPSDDVECFLFSGHRVWSPELIAIREEKYARPPVWQGRISEAKDGNPYLRTEENGLFWIWRYPQPVKANEMGATIKDQYVVIVDVGGRNASSDYNVITVIDRRPMMMGGCPEVVARWRGHIRYDQLAYKAMTIAKYYNDAHLVFESNTFDKKKAEADEFVEMNDHTLGILNVIRGKYKNLYLRKATSAEDIAQGIVNKVGFQTNRSNKPEMVDVFTVEFENDRWIDPDSRFYAEAKIYEERDGGVFGNIVGKNNHDDIVMTDMIGCLVISKMPPPTLQYPDTGEEFTDDYREPVINESDFP